MCVCRMCCCTKKRKRKINRCMIADFRLLNFHCACFHSVTSYDIFMYNRSDQLNKLNLSFSPRQKIKIEDPTLSAMCLLLDQSPIIIEQ